MTLSCFNPVVETVRVSSLEPIKDTIWFRSFLPPSNAHNFCAARRTTHYTEGTEKYIWLNKLIADSINDMIEVGETEKVQRLIECGADVNAHGGYEQRTPCHCAATAGHPALLEWMLATAGADPNPTNRKNNTPLAEVGRCRLNTPALKASAP